MKSDKTPLALAISHLEKVVEEGKDRKIDSPTFKSIEILLHSFFKHRQAIEIAGNLVVHIESFNFVISNARASQAIGNKARADSLEKSAQGIYTKVPSLISEFKKLSLEARMEQTIVPSSMGGSA